VAEIERSHKLRRSQGESPNIGYSKLRRREERGRKESRWIWVVGGSLDREAYRALGGSEVEWSHFRHQKSRSAECSQ
jgi:hypothetical protein